MPLRAKYDDHEEEGVEAAPAAFTSIADAVEAAEPGCSGAAAAASRRDGRGWRSINSAFLGAQRWSAGKRQCLCDRMGDRAGRHVG